MKGDLIKCFTNEHIHFFTQKPIHIFRNYNLIQRIYITFHFHLSHKSVIFGYTKGRTNADFCFVKYDREDLYIDKCSNETYEMIRPFKHLINHTYFKHIKVNTIDDYLFIPDQDRFSVYKEINNSFVNSSARTRFTDIFTHEVQDVRTFYDIFQKNGINYIMNISLTKICLAQEQDVATRDVRPFEVYDPMLYIFDNDVYDESLITSIIMDMKNMNKDKYTSLFVFGVYKIQLRQYNGYFNKDVSQLDCDMVEDTDIYLNGVNPKLNRLVNGRLNINESWKFAYNKPVKFYQEKGKLSDDELCNLFCKKTKKTKKVIEPVIEPIEEPVEEPVEEEFVSEEPIKLNIIYDCFIEDIIFEGKLLNQRELIDTHINSLIYETEDTSYLDLYNEFKEIVVVKTINKTYTDTKYINIRIGNKQFHVFLTNNYKYITNITYIVNKRFYKKK